jgi:hypothetical protein
MRRWQARKVARVWGRARNCEWRDLPGRSGVLSQLGGAREMSVPGCRQVHMRPASDRPGREWCDSGSIQGKPPGYLPRRGGVLDVRGARSPVQRAVAKVHLRSERRAALSQRGVTLSWSTSVRDYCERTGPGLSPPMSLATSLFCLRCWSRFVAGGMPAATTSPVWVLSSWLPRGPGLVCVSRPGDPRSGRSGCWSHSRVYLQLPVPCAASLPAVTGFDRGQLRAWLRGAVSTGPASRPNRHPQWLDRLRSGTRGHVFGCALGIVARAHRAPPDASARMGYARDWKRARKIGRLLLATSAAFATLLVLRSIDFAACRTIPIGTHFLWHLLNAWVL